MFEAYAENLRGARHTKGKTMITPYTLNEWREVREKNEVAITLRQFEAHLDDVLTGKRLAVFIFGGSGLGKNHFVEAALAKHRKEAVFATPKVFTETLDAFHSATHKRRNDPRPLVFDEAQLIFASERNLNIMKDATDKAGRRYYPDYTWWSEEFDDDTGKVRKVKNKGVSLAAPVIAMTNRNLDELGGDVAEALVNSRVLPINLTNDPLVVWEYVVWLALDSRLLELAHGNRVTLAIRTKVLDWFTENLWNLKQVSIRTLLNILNEFTLPNTEMRKANLNLLLKPKTDRTSNHTPQPPDWSKLKREW